MKAVRLYTYGGPDVLRYEEDAPEPHLPKDAVLIEAIAASVNPIDWKIRSGSRQKDFPLALPAILGKDVSGVVRAVGADAGGFSVGDRVIAMGDATYAGLVVVPAALVTRLPDGLDPVDAAALPLAALTGDQLVRMATRVEARQTVVVTGALGSVGRAAVYAAGAAGATVIAGVRQRQLAEAENLGAAGVVALDDDAAVAALPVLDAVADTVGGETAARLLARVRDGGRFGYASVLPAACAERHPSVTIDRVFAKPDPSRLLAFAEALRNGSFVLPITQRLPLRDASIAHEQLEKGGGGKIVLTM